MKKEVEVKVKVGDHICIVNPVNTHGRYENGNEGEITKVDEGGVFVFFDHYEKGSGSMYVLNEEFEVIAPDGSKTAESLRTSILDIRSKREALQKEILQLNEQEKEAVEKLKGQGFVLYEDDVSKKSVATEKKAVLYAEDIEEDMTDPVNWKVGDLIESIDEWIAPIGSLATITQVEGGCIYRTGGDGFSSGNFSHHSVDIWKFHSRPVK